MIQVAGLTRGEADANMWTSDRLDALLQGRTRVIHAHNDVKFHPFIPISGTMQLDLEGAPSVTVAPWHPYFMSEGTRHGFRNVGTSPVDIMEVFIR
ncbi:MAG: hypothetical protein ACRD1Q_11935 [Vicinamibacterales bacterium]